jgi:hypothetical protein
LIYKEKAPNDWGFFILRRERDYATREPLRRGSKQLKSQLLRNFAFFLSHCLQKQAFDACKTKKPA